MTEARSIRRLPPALANRIAAGEVVERPASVVKELVENALDAGATKLVVELEKAGKELIRLQDDGSGMRRDDALLAIERHATSKLRNEEDLFAIRTLGFRGEALPSIASVSHFMLATRPREEEAGTRLFVEGGELKGAEDAAALPGTLIEVRHLFYNVPARLKFLKSDASELASITETLERVAMANPGLRLILRHNGRELMNLAPAAELSERLAALWGAKVYARLFPVHGERGEIRVTGMIGAPDQTRPNPTQIHLFLNGRPIRDRSLQHAVMSSYGMMLEPKRFPVAALLIEMPPERVDVNVHPAKSEVRFGDPHQVYGVVQESVREAIGRAPWTSSAPIASFARPALPERVGDAMQAYAHREPAQTGFALPGGHQGSLRPPAAFARPSFIPAPETPATETFVAAQPAPTSALHSETPNTYAPSGGFSAFPILAQLRNTYILVETPYGLGLIDQHAAHERITFERLKAARAQGTIEQQTLLFPLRLELDRHQLAAFETGQAQLAELGFSVEAFGGDSVQVRAVPYALTGADIQALLRDLLDDWAHAAGSHRVEDQVDESLATMACHASVRANQALSYAQMEALLKQMDQVDFAAQCPHGRPVFVTLSFSELEKRFGRIK